MLLNDVKSKSLMLFGVFSEDLEKKLAKMEIEDDHFTVSMCELVGGGVERLGKALGIRDEKINEATDLRDDLRKLLLLAPDDTAKTYVEVQLRTIEAKIKFMCNIRSATYWIKNYYADVQDMLDEIDYAKMDFVNSFIGIENEKNLKVKVKDLLPIKKIFKITVYLPCREKLRLILLGKPLEDNGEYSAPALEVNDKVRWNGVKLYAPVYLVKWNNPNDLNNPIEIIPSGETWIYPDLGWRGYEDENRKNAEIMNYSPIKSISPEKYREMCDESDEYWDEVKRRKKMRQQVKDGEK